MSIVDDINDISDAVMRLEEKNEELRQQIDALTYNKGNFDDLIKQAEKVEAQNKLIELLADDIEWQETHLTERTSDKMKAIVEAYRAVRPKP